MLLKDYEEYCKNLGLSKRTIGIYRGKLQIFLNSGFSENDLIGSVDLLIKKHSKGGSGYSPEDRGNTLAALNKLKDYILAPYAEQIFISYKKAWASFVPQNKYVSSYQISNGMITISYNKGHTPLKTVDKKIPKARYNQLIDIMIKYKKYLSASDTVTETTHGPGDSYCYTLDNKHQATNCANLFDGKQTDPVLIAAENEYRDWLLRFIPEW